MIKEAGGGASFALERWNDPESSAVPWMTAVFGAENEALPEGFVTINTENHTFSVHRLVSVSAMSQSAFFVVGTPGRLRLSHVQGPVAGFSDPEEYLTIGIREDGLIKSTSRQAFVRDTRRFVDYSEWPGFDAHAAHFRPSYPDFDSYEELIACADIAFEFFLSHLDPRQSSIAGSKPESNRRADETRPRTKYSAELSWKVDRPTPMTDNERALVDQILEEMPTPLGQGLLFHETVANPTTLMQGSSALWGVEPIEDIVNDLHRKLNGLSLMRRNLARSLPRFNRVVGGRDRDLVLR